MRDITIAILVLGLALVGISTPPGIGTVGNLALILALGLTLFGTIASFFAAYHARERFRQAAVRSYVAASLLVVVAVFSLGWLLHNDAFYNAYVYGHSNHTLPDVFKLTALWGGSQGSLLWWTMILCAYTCCFLFFTRKAPRLMMSWALFLVGLGLSFFLLINNIVSNPFEVWAHEAADPNVIPALFHPRDGNGLNPQLQHWAMIIHPPLLYTGYIGFLFPFAIAMGALITKMEGREWIRIIRNWTLSAWLILTIGIILGGAWAYMELGWGGYWAWDPVENASFMPWLLGTAFIHSVMAEEKRGMFKLWNMLLIIGTYLMCMFGTFITRSGLISSVHAFAESDIGYYFIGYIALNFVISMVILMMRRGQLKDDNAYNSFTSREVGLLFNNILFISICVTMLLATIYPMLTEAIYGTKRELRHGFYNTVELPIFLLLLFTMAMGPILTWKYTSKHNIQKRFIWPAVFMVITAVVTLGVFRMNVMPGTSFAVLAFLLVTIIQEFWSAGAQRAKRAGENPLTALVSITRMNKRRYGGYIAHFGVLIIALGITGAAFNTQDKRELGVGETMDVGGFTFQVEKIWEENTPNYYTMHALVNLIEDGQKTQQFHPEQRLYHASKSQASEVGIGITAARDYYVVLAGPGEGNTNEYPIGAFHIYVNPLVMWIWVGSVILFLGTCVSMLPEPVRVRASASAAIQANQEPA